jgi:hypothetical protein
VAELNSSVATSPAAPASRKAGAAMPWAGFLPGWWLGRYACGWLMLTSQVMPNSSTTMPNSSPQGCFCIGIVVFPPAASFSQ